jgi:outer membrane PBP1 activator LpoA protein
LDGNFGYSDSPIVYVQNLPMLQDVKKQARDVGAFLRSIYSMGQDRRNGSGGVRTMGATAKVKA